MTALRARSRVPVSLSEAELRRLYDDIVVRATRHAARRLSRGDAMEVAHDVAVELVRRRIDGRDDPHDPRSYDGLIYRAVLNRLNNLKRGGDRRDAANRVHLDDRTHATPAWAAPDAQFDARELAQVIDRAVAAMPEAMRRVFHLVRVEELSYREAADRLGIGVGTIHTQLARASQRLREVVERYHADHAPAAPASTATTSRNTS